MGRCRLQNELRSSNQDGERRKPTNASRWVDKADVRAEESRLDAPEISPLREARQERLSDRADGLTSGPFCVPTDRQAVKRLCGLHGLDAGSVDDVDSVRGNLDAEINRAELGLGINLRGPDARPCFRDPDKEGCSIAFDRVRRYAAKQAADRMETRGSRAIRRHRIA